MPLPGKFVLQDVSELPEVGVCMAIYGPPGSGKTPIACDACQNEHGYPVALINIESGAKSVMHLKGKVKVVNPSENGRPKPWRWEDVRELVLWIRDEPAEKLGYKTFVIDNMSEAQNLVVDWARRNDPRGAQPVTEIQHHNRATAELLQMVRTLRDAAESKNINIIFIAWQAPEKDEITGIVKQDVGFTPSFARQFPGLVDIVGYLSVEPKGRRKLSFEPSVRTAARFRRSQLPESMKIPSEILFGIGDYPVADMIATIKTGAEFPEKYAKRQTP